MANERDQERCKKIDAFAQDRCLFNTRARTLALNRVRTLALIRVPSR